MIKRRDKKGEALSSNSVNWGIALMVLLVVFLAIYFLVDRSEAAGTNIPEQESVISQGCALVASETTAQAYCTQLRKLRSDLYITCDEAITYGVVVDSSDVDKMNNLCNHNEWKDALQIKVKRECGEGGIFEGDENIKINGKTCSEWLVDLSCEEFCELKGYSESYDSVNDDMDDSEYKKYSKGKGFCYCK